MDLKAGMVGSRHGSTLESRRREAAWTERPRIFRADAPLIGLRNRICFGYDVVRVRPRGQETRFMSSEHHEHGPPEVEPDENDYSAIHQLIVGVAIFVVISMAGVAVWLDAEIEHVTASSVAGAAQE